MTFVNILLSCYINDNSSFRSELRLSPKKGVVKTTFEFFEVKKVIDDRAY